MTLRTKRILVFRVGELGDTLIALPSLHAIRSTYPDAHITFLGNVDSNSKNVTAKQTIPSSGLIDDWLSYSVNGGGWRGLQSLSLMNRLRKCHFDTLVYLAPRLRKPKDVRRDLFFFRMAGIKEVIGHHGLNMPMKTPGEPLPEAEHELDHLLHRLNLSGVKVPLKNGRIDLKLTAQEKNTADSWLRKEVKRLEERVLVGIGPGSKWPSKIWPEERFQEVGLRLIRDFGVFPIVFGGPEDRALADRLIKNWKDGSAAAGALTPREAAAALSQCVLYVGNDTGTMHLAAAVDTPCVAIMSALDWPGRWVPYGPGHTVLRRSVPCEGCLLKVCDKEGMRCLKMIEVDDVVDACSQILSCKLVSTTTR
ncbi:MAG TPA: glycosyltransferase family 9 protein [Pyrinomonadaceae bacterium]|nr:glycosyltransferase family 9 protein [Pyrinomonadaceae bacterium]